MSISVNFHDKRRAIVPDIWPIAAVGAVVRRQKLSRHESVMPNGVKTKKRHIIWKLKHKHWFLFRSAV
jgi:hypothetical protein